MNVDFQILPATDIDYSNVEEICGYQLLMCKIYEREGGLSYPFRTNASIREVQQQGRVWLKNVNEIIEDIVAGNSTILTMDALPRLLDSYDFYYRVCNGRPAHDYIRIIRLRIAERWAKGDKSISETYLVLELLKEMHRNNQNFDNQYSMFALRTLGDWIEELLHYGKFSGIPQAEAYARLRYMIDENLFAYLDSEEEAREKTRWISSYTLSEVQIDTLDAKTLEQYIGFVLSALMYNKQTDEYEYRYSHYLSKLAVRPTIHPYYSDVIVLELAKFEIA